MLSPKLREEVEKKVGEIVSFREAWNHAVGQAIDSGLGEESLLLVVKAFCAPASLIKLTESIGRFSQEDQVPFVNQIEQCATDSDFSVSDWLQAMERILQYLIKKNRSSSISVLLGYLSCCAEYLSASTGVLSFPDGVDEFLEEFGFDG